MSCATALITEIEIADLVGPQADNDNNEDTFDNLARDVVAILLSDGVQLLAG